MSRLLVLLAALLALAGCSTSKDAVASGQEFQFVAPGGQTEILYDPPAARGAVGALAGDSLLEPGRTIGLADYPGHTHSTTDPRWADLAGLLAGDEKQNETGSERAVATEEN